MKEMILRSLMVATIVLGFLLGFAFTGDAEVKDLGEVCFDIRPSIQFIGSIGQMQLGVLSFGSGHFILEGKMIPGFLLEPYSRVHGNAFVVGDKIELSLASSSVNSLVSPRSGRVYFFHGVLDVATLSGRYIVSNFLLNESSSSLLTPGIDGGEISIRQCQQ